MSGVGAGAGVGALAQVMVPFFALLSHFTMVPLAKKRRYTPEPCRCAEMNKPLLDIYTYAHGYAA